MALEVAFDTLPHAIGKLPAAREIFANPVSVIHQMVAQADYFLEKVTIRFSSKPFVVILTGAVGEGKTNLLAAVAGMLEEKNIPAGGILSPAIIENGQRAGYDLMRIPGGEREKFSRISGPPGLTKVGKFTFYASGLDFGKEALDPGNNRNSKIIMVDEIGPWELEEEGWAGSVNSLLKTHIPMVWVVRETLVEKVIDEWNLTNYKIFRVSGTTAEEISEFIIRKIIQ
jgi:nucleoside-triphosphatase THEP1